MTIIVYERETSDLLASIDINDNDINIIAQKDLIVEIDGDEGRTNLQLVK